MVSIGDTNIAHYFFCDAILAMKCYVSCSKQGSDIPLIPILNMDTYMTFFRNSTLAIPGSNHFSDIHFFRV